MYKGRKTSCIKDLNNFGTILFMFPKYFMLNAQIFLKRYKIKSNKHHGTQKHTHLYTLCVHEC